jgi:hypothetical protein
MDHSELHQRLVDFNRARLSPDRDPVHWRRFLDEEREIRIAEGEFIERERANVAGALEDVPRDPRAFVAWFEELKSRGPGQGDPLFPWLSTRATLGEMRWFLRQEVAGEAGFDDLVSLTQVKLPVRPKLEMARNYWDEMGRGTEGGMHGPMLARLALELGLGDSDDVVWESLALGNLMVGLALNRHLTYQSIGALGAIELTAPGRAAQVNAGLKRLGVGGEARRYFALHATLDVKHSEGWDAEVLHPLVADRPDCAWYLAEGALMRLSAGARCFARYRRELGLPQERAA